MHRLWHLIEPVLVAAEPKTIIEVGVWKGDNTRKLSAFCKEVGAVLHAVDPAPLCDMQEFDGTVHFHKAFSPEVISVLPEFDVILLDGDHNAFTVRKELEAIASHSPNAVILLHDTGWPYAWRDLYMHPERIPEDERCEFKEGGLLPGTSEVLREGGINHDFIHGTEIGEHWGVLGGVNAFLRGHADENWKSVRIDGFHGLTILASSRALSARPMVQALLNKLNADPMLMKHATLLEQARIHESVLSMAAAKGESSDLVTENYRLMKEALELAAQNAALQRTKSWRWTAPLRWIFRR